MGDRLLVIGYGNPLRGDDAMREVVEGARRIFAATEAARERTTIMVDGSVDRFISD